MRITITTNGLSGRTKLATQNITTNRTFKSNAFRTVAFEFCNALDKKITKTVPMIMPAIVESQ
ncbi:MAG TPA: hypothetical protein VFF13_03420 [archaeon]|nr:hypothetical protein [archaeon]